MNYTDHPQQQQYMMAQGQRMQNPRMVNVPTNMPQHMQRQPRYGVQVPLQNQQPMQLAPGQYIQSPQMTMRNQIGEMVARLPPDMQAQAQARINAEPNPETRKQIAMGFLRQAQQMRMGPMYNQQDPQSTMMTMNAAQRVGMPAGNMPGAGMQRIGVPQNVAMSQGVFQNQSPPMQSNMSSVAPGQVPMQRPAGHGFMAGGMQQVQNFAVSQEPTSSAATIPNYSSPQPSNIQQPSSVGPAIQQNASLQQKGPNSVPPGIYGQSHPPGSIEVNAALQSAPSQEEEKVSATDKALYEAKLTDLKAHHEQIRRLKERQLIDGVRTKPVYERLLEVIEGRRIVKIELLVKLADSVQTLFEKNSPLYPLMELLKRMPVDLASTCSLPDPWGELRQFAIKSPDFYGKENDTTVSLKRAATPAEGNAVKRIKRESTSVTASQVKLEPIEELPSGPCKEEYRYEESRDDRGFDIRDGYFAVRCKNGTRLDLSAEIPMQLRNTRYKIDPDMAPVSNECNEVQILVENDFLLVPPLRIVVPVNYPEVGAAVWREPRITDDPTINELNQQFDKRLVTTQDSNSIPQILHAWKVASEFVYKASSTVRRSKQKS